jgi:hypothetical protein
VSIFTRSHRAEAGIQRNELVWAAAEVAAIFTIFVIAFTGRSAFGDGVRQILIALSLIAGTLGTVAGLIVVARGLQYQVSRVPRLMLGAFMAAIGIYTIVHVL